MKRKNRVKEPRRIKARELVHDPKNKPLSQQRHALQSLLNELGHADALPVCEPQNRRFLVVDGRPRRRGLEFFYAATALTKRLSGRAARKGKVGWDK